MVWRDLGLNPVSRNIGEHSTHWHIFMQFYFWLVSLLSYQKHWTQSDQQKLSNDEHVAEKTSYFCLARKLIWPLGSTHIFTQWGWPILFSPDHFSGQHQNFENPPKYLFLRTFSNRAAVITVRSLHSSSIRKSIYFMYLLSLFF